MHNGDQVTGLVHQTPPRFHNDNISYITGDLTRKSTLNECCKDIDIVFHCAGLVNDYANAKQLYDVHVTGTKHLVNSCKQYHCKRLIVLSHIPYESTKKTYPYPHSKAQAEAYLLDEYQNNDVPIVIVRPGNVYGPNAQTWVVRPIHAINKKRIALIDGGRGIFHHTYIDNLIDALVKTMDTSGIDGRVFEVTDGDNTITWKQYFDDLCTILNRKPITKSFSSSVAKMLGSIMLFGDHVFKIPPLLTPYAVEIFSNTTKISISKAKDELGYIPRIDYQEGMKRIEHWIIQQGIDTNL
jgi:nucleoside-diphosphate-sugar epimerase